MIPFISIKLIIDVNDNDPKIEFKSMLLDSKSKVNITLDSHWIIAPIEKAINTDNRIPITISVAFWTLI